VRLYVPAAVADLRRLETDGSLADDGRLVALAVTPWALAELGLDDAEDEEAEFAVLAAAAEQQVDGGPPAAVLVFDVPVGEPPAEPPSEGLEVPLDRPLPRRRLAALHLPPDLRWYAGHELPDVLAALT
jgi:hypothetical protein